MKNLVRLLLTGSVLEVRMFQEVEVWGDERERGIATYRSSN